MDKESVEFGIKLAEKLKRLSERLEEIGYHISGGAPRDAVEYYAFNHPDVHPKDCWCHAALFNLRKEVDGLLAEFGR